MNEDYYNNYCRCSVGRMVNYDNPSKPICTRCRKYVHEEFTEEQNKKSSFFDVREFPVVTPEGNLIKTEIRKTFTTQGEIYSVECFDYLLVCMFDDGVFSCRFLNK